MKLGIGLFLLSVIISIVLLNPAIKSRTMSLLLSTQKKILSQMEMTENGTTYKVVKVQNVRGLAIEVYKLTDDGPMLLDFQQLTDKKDAFYKFDDQKHNLFLKDVTDDGVADIILPSIDKNMKARLNIFSFDTVNERLQKVSKH